MIRFTSDVGRIAGELPEALAILDPDDGISWINDAAASLLGVQPARWIGRPVHELVHPEDRSSTAAALDSGAACGPGAATAVRVHDGDAGWRRVVIRGRRIRSDAPDHAFTVIVLRDHAD